MTKEEWLQICRLNQEWYYHSTLNDITDDWIVEHMPSDKVFDDGRIEFFEKNFKKEPIDENKLAKLAINECSKLLKDDIIYYEAGDECVECVVLSDAEKCYKAGYHKAVED